MTNENEIFINWTGCEYAESFELIEETV